MDQAIRDLIDRQQRETHSEQNESRYTNVVCDRDFTLMQSATASYPRGLFRETYPGFKCPNCSRFFAKENGYVDAKWNGVENLRDDPRCPKGSEQRMYLQSTPDGLYWQCYKCNASQPYLPIAHMTSNEIERQILEAIKRLADEERRKPQPKDVFSSEMVRAGTPFGHAASSRDEFLDRLDILADRAFIREIKNPAAPAVRMIGLAPAGKARLLISEKEFQKSENRTAISHTSHTLNVNAPIQNFAHSSGDNSPVQQTIQFSESERSTILGLVDRLIEELKKHPEASDAVSDIEQLRIEVSKPKPIATRINDYLVPVVTLAKTVAALAPYIMELKKHFPFIETMWS